MAAGMVMGDLDTPDENLREMATALQMPIASIDYRKAPEDPYPAAPEDCYAGVCWVFDNASGNGNARVTTSASWAHRLAAVSH